MKAQSQTQLSHLQLLEAEAIHIIREAVAEAVNPVMLYSIGKDSSVMLHLAQKAFYPAPLPFPLLHVDTTWKFKEMIEFRAKIVDLVGADLLVHQNPECIELGINPFDHGSSVHTDMWKTQGLKQALDKYNFDLAFGGARRDEEKSRAKERVFSFRSDKHVWDPKINDQNSGTSTTLGMALVSQFVYFRCPTGQNSMFGNISISKQFLLCLCTLPKYVPL